MKFRVGQVWKDGKGSEVTIKKIRQLTGDYPITGSDVYSFCVAVYTADGKYVHGKTSQKDLVELVKDVPSMQDLLNNIDFAIQAAKDATTPEQEGLWDSLDAVHSSFKQITEKQYSVVWEIDLWGYSREDIAKEAFAIMKDYCADKIQKPVFKVDGVEIDLSKDDE